MSSSSNTIQIEEPIMGIRIPDGIPATIPPGSAAVVTQSLGGTYTLSVFRAGLYRVSGDEAAKLGLDPDPEGGARDTETELPIEDRVEAALRSCYDPEIPVNIMDLGLVYGRTIKERDASAGGGYRVEVRMTLTAPGCGMGPILVSDVEDRLYNLRGVEEVEVDIVFDPPWGPDLMTDEARLELGLL